VLEQGPSRRGRRQADRLAGQGSIFDLGPVSGLKATPARLRTTIRPVPAEDSRRTELLNMEKEVLGLYVTEHPLQGVRDQLRRKTDATIGELERRRDGEVITIGGSSPRSGT